MVKLPPQSKERGYRTLNSKLTSDLVLLFLIFLKKCQNRSFVFTSTVFTQGAVVRKLFHRYKRMLLFTCCQWYSIYFNPHTTVSVVFLRNET